MEIITLKSAMALKTDVHRSVIYSTRTVSADKVNLACQTPPPGSGLLSRTLQDPRVAGWGGVPLNTSGSPLTLHLRLHKHLSSCVFACVRVIRGKLLSLYMLKSVIVRPLIPALRQPLALPGSFLRGPAGFSLTSKSMSPWLPILPLWG